MQDNLHVISRKLLYKELMPVWNELALIRYAVVKGDILSQQIYSTPDMRESSDIDILIEKENIKTLEQMLIKAGFHQQVTTDRKIVRKNRVMCIAYSHQIPSYHKNIFGFHLNVDINYDIFWGEYEGSRCSIPDFLSDTVEMKIYNATVKTLPIDKAFVQLVLHHYKDMNSLYHLSQYNCIRTELFKDVYDMLILNEEILTVSKVVSLCEKYKIFPIMYYMLYYAKLVFATNYLDEYLSALRHGSTESFLDSYGLCSTERKQWHIPFDKRLDNDNLWHEIVHDMSEEDLNKISLGIAVFT